MYTLAALLCSTAFAATPAVAFSTVIPTRSGDAQPFLLLGAIDAPNPDFSTDGRVVVSRGRYGGDSDLQVVLGVDDARRGVSEILYWPSPDADPVVVWGRGAVEKAVPPDPYKAVGADLPPGPWSAIDAALPPGPCFDFVAVLGDGTELEFAVAVQSENGVIDPGEAVGFNPQPDPPGIVRPGEAVGFNPQPDPPGHFQAVFSLDLGTYARAAGGIQVSVALIGEKALLPIQ